VSTFPKRTFLACHDYGMGGIWILIDAETAVQVEHTYPELKVIESRPPWLEGSVWANIQARLHFDIDSPSGWLLSLKRSEGA
jgi:hypothetical protein